MVKSQVPHSKMKLFSGPRSESGTRIGSYYGIIDGIEEIEDSTLVDSLVSESGSEIGYSYDMLCRNEVVKLERYSLVESLGTYVMGMIRLYNGSSDRNINGNLYSSALGESLVSEVGTDVVPSSVI